MRGTHRRTARAGRHVGIIPAHAGNTIPTSPFRCSCRDHPRACGEHVKKIACKKFDMGSSPRMRGTRRWAAPMFSFQGIIPAHAGNTWMVRVMMSAQRDHPRACGEHYNGQTKNFKVTGSSPRMRGTRQTVHRLRRPAGIIPAHAGNTSRPCMMPSLVQDHPRACGEHYRTGVVPFAVSGSSPRMRGTQHVCWYFCVIHGIIPAHAGNTGRQKYIDNLSRDHPRACGEHWYVRGACASP